MTTDAEPWDPGLTPTAVARFWAKVARGDADACWPWIASKDRDGYGKFAIKRRSQFAHRVAWVLANGPIPDGLTVDHMCYSRACVNPAHLRLLPRLENCTLQRSVFAEACHLGHLFTPENTYVRTSGRRFCRQCGAIHTARYMERKKREQEPNE